MSIHRAAKHLHRVKGLKQTKTEIRSLKDICLKPDRRFHDSNNSLYHLAFHVFRKQNILLYCWARLLIMSMTQQ